MTFQKKKVKLSGAEYCAVFELNKGKTHKMPSLDTLPWVRPRAKMPYQSF